MYGEVKRGNTSNYLVVKTKSVQFKTCEISIARCTKSKEEDNRSRLMGLVSLVCCVGIAYLITSNDFGLTGWLSYIAIAGLTGALFIVSIILVGLLLSSRPSVSRGDIYNFYPPIMGLVSQGWMMGDRPPRDF